MKIRLLGKALFSTALLAGVNLCFGITVTPLTIDDGLKTNTVEAVVQDAEEFIWIGSYSGVSRYDGYSFQHFVHEPENPKSLSNNHINGMVVDKRNNLWIATRNGLNRFNPTSLDFNRYSFTRLPHASRGAEKNSHVAIGPSGVLFAHYKALFRYNYDTDALEAIDYAGNDEGFYSDDVITAVIEDRRGKIWIALELGGLMVFDPEKASIKSLDLVKQIALPHKNSPYSPLVINTLLEDELSTVWVGTEKHGLIAIHRDGTVEHMQADKENNQSLPDNEVRALYIDNQGILWIGTKKGLAEKDRYRPRFISYRFEPTRRRGLTNDTIQAIYQDKSGLIWIGTETGGANLYNPATEYFHHQTVLPKDPSTLSGKVIRGFAEDHQGYVWIGTHQNGINRFLIHRKQYKHYRYDENDEMTIPDDRVSAIYEDNDLDLWVTTIKGLARYDRVNDRFERVFDKPSLTGKLHVKRPISIMQDSDNFLWIGTRGEGLIRYDKGNDTFERYVHRRTDKHSISHNSIRPILEDKNGYLWIGTLNGLNRMDRATGHITQFHHNPQDPTTLSHHHIFTLLEDSKGVLWIGTDKGLNRFNEETGNFTTFTQDHGLPNNSIYGILEDTSQRHLWLSTNFGLSRMDIATSTFKNYDISHGLQSNEFNPPSAMKTRSGLMFFGGVDGFNFFNPRYITNINNNPTVVITSIDSIAKSRLPDLPPHRIQSLDLKHTDQVISFQFSALDFTNTRKNQYRHMLEGFDQDWISKGRKNSATYTNLDPGNYTFKVKGSNSDGVWSNNTASIDITVYPAPWATIWAKSFYATCLLLLILYYIYKHQKELTKEREVASKLREVSALKDQFLATTSHELRTPMNGVIGTASLLSETNLTSEQKEFVDLIRISSENLLAIINDILDFSRIEAGKVDLDNRYFSLSQLFEEVLDIFAAQAQKNSIELIYSISSSIPDSIYSDSTRLRQVLINLIGNAFKFTQKGEIIVSVSLEHDKNFNQHMKFTISDTGIGIPEEKMAVLFEAFTQGDASTTRRFGGTGLGLAISRKLVQLMGGSISVESEVNKGTSFYFTIPQIKDSIEHRPNTRQRHLFKRQQLVLCHENNAIADVVKQNLQQWRLNVLHYNYLDTPLDELDTATPSLLLINHNKKITEVGAVKALIDKFPKLPIIFISASKNEELTTLYDSHFFEVKSPIKWQRLYAMCSALLQISDFSPESEKERENQTPLNVADRYPATILVAEDNPINQRICYQMLTRLGYKDIDIVFNGLAAVEATRKKHYDLILMDVQMPEMDGLDATREIVKARGEGDYQKIIALTANAMDGDREKCLEAGMDSYMSKPVKMLAMRELLSQILSPIEIRESLKETDQV